MNEIKVELKKEIQTLEKVYDVTIDNEQYCVIDIYIDGLWSHLRVYDKNSNMVTDQKLIDDISEAI